MCRAVTTLVAASPDSVQHLWVSTHPQVVVAAPHGHPGALPPRQRVVLGEREHLAVAVDGLEDAVRVVVLLLCDLVLEEAVVVVAAADCRDKKETGFLFCLV